MGIHAPPILVQRYNDYTTEEFNLMYYFIYLGVWLGFFLGEQTSAVITLAVVLAGRSMISPVGQITDPEFRVIKIYKIRVLVNSSKNNI